MTDITVAVPARTGFAIARLAKFAPALAVFALAVLIRVVLHLNPDVSWLLLVGDKMLHGARVYVDVIETNPPASILLYLPAVWMENHFGIAAETVVVLSVFAESFASLALCRRLLLRAKLIREDELPLFAGAALLMLLVLPFDTFAEREQIALIGMLPTLCVFMSRLANVRVEPGLAIVAGLGAGAAVAIKFYFALPLLTAFSFLLWQNRRDLWKAAGLLFAPENAAALLVACGYGAVVWRCFPAFSQNILPLLLTLYVPVKASVWFMMATPSFFMWAAGAVAAVALARRKILEPLPAILLLASFGFVAAVLLQGKGWPYHGYPALALVLLLLGILLLRERGPRLRISAALAVAAYAILLPLSTIWFDESNEPKRLVGAVAQLAPQHPRIIAISDDLAIGSPLTRLVHGEWVGTTHSQWMTDYAHYLLRKTHPDAQTAAQIRRYATLDRDMLASDIASHRPDVVLVDRRAEHAWILGSLPLKAMLLGYREIKSVSGVEIWLRKTGA